MKRILNLIVILGLFSQVCNAQQIETEEEYKVFYDSIVSLLKIAEKDSSSCIGKPFSELVKHLDKCEVKIVRVMLSYYDHQKLYPQYLWGISLMFTTYENSTFARVNYLREPSITVYFDGSKPYEKAFNLSKKYKGYFKEEVEEFYSDAVVKSISFSLPDDMYHPLRYSNK